jgi:peptidyl-prolyl cis-trans isomerase A (cyclophilin A)
MTRLSLLWMAMLGLGATRAGAVPTSDGLFAGFFTGMGTFWCRLEFQKAPRTVANFVSLVEGTRDWIDFPRAQIVRRPFYDGLTFHRVVDDFIIQAGSPNGLGTDGPGFELADEFHPELRHSRPGILSMANSGVRNSNGSQFFLTLGGRPALDDRHSVFGEVVEGMEVVVAISKAPTNILSRPLTPVLLNEVRVRRNGAEAAAFNPAGVAPPAPDVGHVPCRFLVSPTGLSVQIEPRTNHIQHVFLTTNLTSWLVNSFTGFFTNLNGDYLRNEPHGFFRVLDGGFEP